MGISDLYCYRARPIKVIDGDTVDLEVDVGFKLTTIQRFRLLGINAPEMKGETLEKAKESTVFLMQEVDVAKNPEGFILITTHKSDSFGRWLVTIYYSVVGGASVNEVMLASGHAVPFIKK